MPEDTTVTDRAFERLAELPAAVLASHLAAQAPQVVATLLLRLPPTLAAETLAGLPEALRPPALRRMAATGPAAPVLMERIAETLRTELLTLPPQPPDRPGALAAILAAMTPEARSAADTALNTTLDVAPPPTAKDTAADAASPAPADDWEAPEGAPPLRLPPGLAALLNSPLVIRDRMPMLEVALDRHVRLLSSRLRALCGDPAEAGLTALSSVRFGDWLNATAPSPATPLPLFVVFRSRGWDHHGLMLVDEDALAGFAEAALGGPMLEGKAVIADRLAGRAPTGLDRCALALLAEGVLDTLNSAFEPIGTPDFRFDRIEHHPRLVAIDRPFNAALLAELHLRTRSGGGRIALLLPYALLEPARDRLTRAFAGERFGDDPRWAAHLGNRLPKARLRVAAVAGTAGVTLGDALAWRPGSVVGLDAPANGAVRLIAGGASVGGGRLERRGGRLVVTLPDLAAGPTAVQGTEQVEDRKGQATMADPNTTDGRTAMPAPAPPATEAPTPPASGGLPALHRVKLRLSAVVGGADLTVEELLQLGRGGIVELDRRVGELMDVTVNDQIVARGELVVIEDRLAVSLTEIVSAPG